MPPSSRWTSYEPGPGGKGYTLYDKDDKPSLFAPTPSLDALLPSLRPRADYLANNGQGGSNGGGDPSQQFAGPPAQVADVGPAYSSQPEPVSKAPPEPPVQPAATQGGTGQGQRPRARVGGTEAPQGGALTPAGDPLDPTQIPASPMSAAERDLQIIEDERWRRAQRAAGGPVTKIQAHWQDKQRTMEGRAIDPAAMAEWEAAQADERARAEGLARSKAEAEAGAEAERKAGVEKENEIAAKKDAAARKYQEDQFKIEGQIEAERKSLENPNDFWEGMGTANQVGAIIALALGNAADALRGGKGDALTQQFNGMIERHAQSRVRNVQMLDQQRGRNRESHEVTQQRLEAERAQAIKATDDRIKGILAGGANPVVRELVMEDVPPSEAKKAAAVALVRGMRKLIPGANQDPADIQKSADEYIATMTPQEKRLVFDMGPNGELIPRENVRYLAAEYEGAKRRLDTARERLGYADKFAESRKLAQEWQPEKTLGGGADPLKMREQQLKDRIKRGADVRESDYKAAGILAPLAGNRQKAAADAADKAEQRAEKEGGRTFVVNGQEYTARPGTDTALVRKIQEDNSTLDGFRSDIDRLAKLSTVKNRQGGGKDLEAIQASMAGKANKLIGAGVMSESEWERAKGMLSSTDWFTPGGVDAARELHNSLATPTRRLYEQVGAKPKGAR